MSNPWPKKIFRLVALLIYKKTYEILRGFNIINNFKVKGFNLNYKNLY